MRVGVLTSGGDAPGLNAAIRAAVAKGEEFGWEVIGIHRGWAGLLDRDAEPLAWPQVDGLCAVGGTILETSRTNPFKSDGGEQLLLDNVGKMGLDAILAIGGDDTLTVAHKLCQRGVPCVGVPKTMDNDVSLTDSTIGFDTAVAISTEAIDRLHTTARSHRRLMVVEVMGRDSGWVAIQSGLAAGAHLVLIPEVPYNLEEVLAFLQKRREHGATYGIIVVAEAIHPQEGAQLLGYEKREVDAFGHIRLGGVGHLFAELLEKKSGWEARSTVLGHLIRSGTPTPVDRILATRLAVKAMEMIQAKRWDQMSALHGMEMAAVPLADVLASPKTVPVELYQSIQLLFR